MWALQALSKGYLTDSLPTAGQVHSVFQHTVNLAVGQGLLTLLDKRYANTPTGIRVDMSVLADWRQILQTGMPFFFKQNQLRCGELTIALMNSMHWQPLVPRYTIDIETLSDTLCFMQQMMQRYCAEQHIIGALPFDIDALRGSSAWLSYNDDAESLQKKLAALIGFGYGLTPDGDDFVIGYLSVLWLTENHKSHILANPAKQSHLKTLCQAIDRYLSHTNTISQHYLSLATQGHFIEPLHQLMQALSHPDYLGLEQAVRDVLAYGASSGASCLTGIILGLNQYINVD